MVDSDQRTEDRRRRTEGGGQTTEDGQQTTEERGHSTRYARRDTRYEPPAMGRGSRILTNKANRRRRPERSRTDPNRILRLKMAIRRQNQPHRGRFDRLGCQISDLRLPARRSDDQGPRTEDRNLGCSTRDASRDTSYGRRQTKPISGFLRLKMGVERINEANLGGPDGREVRSPIPDSGSPSPSPAGLRLPPMRSDRARKCAVGGQKWGKMV